MPQAEIKPATVDYDPLETAAQMGAALGYALGRGYRGSVQGYTDSMGVLVLRIEVNGPGNPQPVTAAAGDVLVWDGSRYEAMNATEFLARATPLP